MTNPYPNWEALGFYPEAAEQIPRISAWIEQEGAAVVHSMPTEPALQDLLTLALCMSVGDKATKQAVEQSFNRLVTTSEQLFAFIALVTALRGWGRSLRRIVASWYAQMNALQLAQQIDESAYGWCHCDVLRLAHVIPIDEEQDALYAYATGRSEKVQNWRGRPSAAISYLHA